MIGRPKETPSVHLLKYSSSQLHHREVGITKTNHNILQWVANSEVRFDAENQALLNEFIRRNVDRYWLSSGGPPAPGRGVVAVIDDPQMPAPIPLIKKAHTEIKIIFLSYIEVRKDLVKQEPSTVSRKRVYRSNREIRPEQRIPNVLESYRKLCDRVTSDAPERHPPQLRICEHGATDDPDAEIVFAETTQFLKKSRSAAIVKNVGVVRIGPSDQILNAMITTTKIVPLLSLREGFEVTVSEAIEHGRSEFLVEVGDPDSVANPLCYLYTDKDLYTKMSKYPKASVSDELTSKLARGKDLELGARWIMDMAMEKAGQKYEIGQPILPREGMVFKRENIISLSWEIGLCINNKLLDS
ncbi:hypothetical protein HOY82DRAFT_540843 [Tuber indicum]|nr:hypothetical protein HOY82DRAFT_540839 [Tuber indicum]KAG0129235.1 hypothetical protein HOY82DRAFT_540843 [Tuber indicum]